jgi:hypothetical protein
MYALWPLHQRHHHTGRTHPLHALQCRVRVELASFAPLGVDDDDVAQLPQLQLVRRVRVLRREQHHSAAGLQLRQLAQPVGSRGASGDTQQ